MATAAQFACEFGARVVSTPHGLCISAARQESSRTTNRSSVSPSDIESIDYMFNRSNSKTSLINSGQYLPPPDIVHPSVSPVSLMELSTNTHNVLEQSLHKAARDGDVLTIKNLVRSWEEKYNDESRAAIKYKLNKKDKSEYTALHYAVRYGHEIVVQFLVEHGADVNMSGDDGTQPIHLAARHTKSAKRTRFSTTRPAFTDSTDSFGTDATLNSKSILRDLLDNFADCNARDAYMQTPLHYAALKGNLDAVKILVNTRGILLQAEDKSKATPLHCACSSGSIDVVNVLLLSGASLLDRDDEGLTPFHYIVIAGNLKLLSEVLSHLQRTNGFVTLTSLLVDRDEHMQTALHHAVMSGNYETTKLLLENRSEVNARRYGNTTPLHLAASKGNIDIVRLLLSYQAEIEARNSRDETALHIAAVMNRENVVSFLIANGANVNALSIDASSPLILAAARNHSRIVDSLVKHGATDDCGDASERTAIYWAASENAMESLQILLGRPDSSTRINIGDRYDDCPLHVAAMKGYTGIVRILIEYGAKLDPVNDEDLTPLHLAAKNGHVRIVRQLLERKPTIVSDEDEAANTALHHAAVAGHADVIQTLIEFGGSVDVRNSQLWTPLDCAAANGRVNAAQVLLERDAPIDATDRAKSTPLHLACKGGHVEMARLLMNNGADITLCDSEGKNCLDIAIDNGSEETSLAILEHKDWRGAMEHRTKERGKITTPMRRMIEKLPAVALAVFNKCIEISKRGGDDVITFYYDFLDDTYSRWNTETRGDFMDNKGAMMDPAFLFMLVKDGKSSPHDAEMDKKENHPLAIMVKHEQEKLLSHPLVASLITAKWRKFGRIIYYSKLSLFIVFLFFLTAYTATSTQYNPEEVNVNGSMVCQEKVLPDDFKTGVFVKAGSVIVVTLAGIQLLFELIQVINKKWSYFRAFENYVETCVFTFAIVYVSDVTEGRTFRLNKCGSVHVSIGSLAIFLAWINLLLFLRKFPKFGIYFVMFLDVFKTFAMFSVTFSLFIVAFGFGFYVLLNRQLTPFSTAFRSIMKSVVMMIGEFEFEGIFENTRYDITWLLFFIFVIVCTIILMNLLIGLAVDDIKSVQDQAALKRIGMQVDLVLEVEKFIPRGLRSHSKLFRIKPKEVLSATKRKTFIDIINPHPASLNAVEKAKINAKETIETVEEYTRSLTDSVAKLKSDLKSVKERFTGIETMLQSILENQIGKSVFSKGQSQSNP